MIKCGIVCLFFIITYKCNGADFVKNVSFAETSSVVGEATLFPAAEYVICDMERAKCAKLREKIRTEKLSHHDLNEALINAVSCGYQFLVKSIMNPELPLRLLPDQDSINQALWNSVIYRRPEISKYLLGNQISPELKPSVLTIMQVYFAFGAEYMSAELRRIFEPLIPKQFNRALRDAEGLYQIKNSYGKP